MIGVWVFNIRASSGDELTNALILPPHSTVAGKTTDSWAIEWWRWVLSESEKNSPLSDDTR
jgi:hypothetical protein